MSIWTAIAGRLNTLHDLVIGESARATAAEATKVNASTYTTGQAAQDAALTAEATTARAAESAALAAAVAPKDRLVAGGQIAVEAVSGGGIDLFNYKWPQWGYGGSATVANLASPTLLDLDTLGVNGLIWMPGQGFSILDNAIRTPFTTDVAGNSGGVAQRLFVDFDLIPNEYDPIAGQSTYYLYNLPNAHWFYLDETGYPTVKFRDGAKVLYTAAATTQYAPKQRFQGYYDLNPNNAAAGNVWTLDFYVLAADGTYESFGDQILGSRAITAWKEVLTDQSDVPFSPQSIYIGTNSVGQVYRGGFIHLAVRVGTHAATPVLECSAEPWAVAGGGTHTERGRVFTLTNASAENFVTASCLAVAPGEYVTLTGDPNAPTSPVTIATTHGLYPTLTAAGFSWDVANPVARDLYRLSNGIVNLAVTPDTRTVPVTVTSAGDIVLDAPKLRIGDDVAATQPYADTTAASARAAAIQISNGYAQEIADELLASIANATPYRETELTLTAGAQRVQYNQVWQVANANHGLPPMGIGDGSALDQQMVLDQASPIFAAAGGTGGFGATPTYLTSLVDNATTPVAGSLRKIINDYNAVWAAWAIGGAVGAEPSLYLVARPSDLTLNGSGEARIALDFSSSSSSVRDIKILARNWTFDFTAIPGGVILDGGGKPGPVPYCTTDVSVSTGGGAHNFHTTNVADFGKTKLRVGTTVDIAKYVGSTWTIYGKDLVVTAINYDNPGTKTGPGSIDVTGTIDITAPVGSTVILSYNPTHNDPNTGVREHLEPGQPGCQFIIGGESYSDLFGPGKPNIPAGNGIIRNMAWRSNWGGDILDTGDLNDFAISYWSDTIWLDHCDWSNPDPFHDTMWQTAKGTRNIGTSFCAFRNHYKAVNHFGGNTGSGGVSPDGTTPSPNVHPFPPIPGDPAGRSYDETNPGPYAFEPGIVGSHGNPTGAPVVIMTALHEHALFDGLGQRAPKNMHFAEMHLLNSVVSNYGLPPGDPILGVSTRFPLDPLEANNGPYPIITGDYAKSLYESVKIIPHVNALSGGFKGIKHTADGKSPGGYIKTSNLTLVGPVVNEPDYDPLGKIPNFAARYPYTAEDATTYVRKVTYGAGAGTQSKMWTLVGAASVQATVIVKANGADIGPGGTLGSSAVLDLVGFGLAYDTLTHKATITAPTMTRVAVVTASASPYTAAANTIVPVDTTAGPVTVILPTAPANGSRNVVKHIIQGGANIVTVTRGGGSDVFNKTGGSTSLTLPTLNQAVGSQYDSGIWTVLYDDLALSVLDARFQPLDSDLTAIAALTTTTYGRALLALADQAALVALLPSYQPLTTNLTALGGVTSAADKLPYFTGSGTASLTALTSFARTLLATTNAAAFKTAASIADAGALASFKYLPTTGQTTASIGTSLTDLTAAGITAAWTGVVAASFDMSFVVPVSQKVIVEFDCLIKGSASGTNLRAAIADPTGAVTYTLAQEQIGAGTGQVRGRFKMLIDYSGPNATVAAGTTVTVRPQMVCNTGTISLDCGSTTGPVQGIVTAA